MVVSGLPTVVSVPAMVNVVHASATSSAPPLPAPAASHTLAASNAPAAPFGIKLQLVQHVMASNSMPSRCAAVRATCDRCAHLPCLPTLRCLARAADVGVASSSGVNVDSSGGDVDIADGSEDDPIEDAEVDYSRDGSGGVPRPRPFLANSRAHTSATPYHRTGRNDDLTNPLLAANSASGGVAAARVAAVDLHSQLDRVLAAHAAIERERRAELAIRAAAILRLQKPHPAPAIVVAPASEMARIWDVLNTHADTLRQLRVLTGLDTAAVNSSAGVNRGAHRG